MTITEFLEARITEDEAEAKEKSVAEYCDGGWSDEHAQRILAECAAKRAIIELAQQASEVEKEFDDYEWRGAGPEHDDPWTGDAILFTLAAVYKEHPDYRQEWAL